MVASALFRIFDTVMLLEKHYDLYPYIHTHSRYVTVYLDTNHNSCVFQRSIFLCGGIRIPAGVVLFDAASVFLRSVGLFTLRVDSNLTHVSLELRFFRVALYLGQPTQPVYIALD